MKFLSGTKIYANVLKMKNYQRVKLYQEVDSTCRRNPSNFYTKLLDRLGSSLIILLFIFKTFAYILVPGHKIS